MDSRDTTKVGISIALPDDVSTLYICITASDYDVTFS